MLKDPIFILGAHKSGTTLLRNLLDGHSELFAIPIEPHPFQMLDKWIQYELRYTYPKKESINQAKKNLVNLVYHLKNSDDKNGGGYVSDKWDLKLFEKELFKTKAKEIQEFIEQYTNAIYSAIYKNGLPKNIRPVEKSVTNAEYAIELSKIFPEAKFIHVIRNPYANVCSIRKYKNKSKIPYLRSIIKSLVDSHYFLYRNMNLIENYLIIKYEDLVEKLSDSISNIAQFLKIKNEEILHKPTTLAEPWYGNSVYGEHSFSVYNVSLEKWKKEITHMEIYLVNKYLEFFLKDFEYLKEQVQRNIYLPSIKENFKSYILNRIFISLNLK